jgi:hypothetical protein
MSAYFAVVQDTYEKFDSARIFCRRTSKKLPSIGQVQTKSSGKFQGSSQYNPRREYRGSHPRLQMLVEDGEEPDSDDDDIDEGDEGDQEQEGDEDIELLIAAQQGTPNLKPQFVKQQVRNQMKPKAADASRKGRSVCLRYEREGKCDYSHEDNDILQFRRDIAARLYNRSEARGESRRLMPNSTSKIHSMVAEDDSEEEDQAKFNIISQLLRVTQDSDG